MTTLLFALAILLAAVLGLFALTRKRDVVLDFKIPGANMRLEAKGDSQLVERKRIRSPRVWRRRPHTPDGA